ncbi:MAG: 50S ribosomal protein L20 [Planctomycetes bacterium]|jgi:large subunit ribosomal protein L20|nr:50S ribosomal protein L20 [Planctomycetota bacterium]MBT6452801.1 50S ribosomal protein L20 [Planctomycetota bacterium]MBT6541665.1 50S ribosomal protein L20 [Planctomycetota bacterium]MBT6785296.1 50S ribosomal protein L20 [Planctomycetota bacterium]MBT6967584.1 50S ribosomal protein L20 [Planctomycetota bacterium]
MARVSFGVARHRKQKRILKKARGFFGAASRQYRTAKQSIIRAEAYATRDRRVRKRIIRRLWITRISAACGQQDISYSRFIHGLKCAKVDLDRKMISDLAIRNHEAFVALVGIARGAIS